MKNLKALMFGFAGLCLAVLLGFGTVRAEAHEDHCVCGGTGDCIATAKKYGHEGVATQGRTEVTWTEVTTSQELLAAISEAKAANETNVYVYLSDSVGESFQMSQGLADSTMHGMHLFLCLNGKNLKTANNARLMTAYLKDSQSEMKLSICDCSSDAAGTISFTGTGISAQGALVTLDPNARFYLYGGTLTGGKAGTYAGNVSVGSGKMYMYGGAITDGTSAAEAGNINVGAGELYIYDGTVSGGTATTSGGNIYLSAGKIYMYDGKIADGTARAGESTSGVGGNARIAKDGEFHILGGKILGGVNQNANLNANGHSIYVDGQLFISGDTIFEASNGQSYPMCLQNAAGVIEISGNPVFYKNGGNANLIQGTAAGGAIRISGGKYIGLISGHKGNIYVSGGEFSQTIGHAKNSGLGVLEITGGYFAGKSTSAALSIPDTVWKVGEDAWIPFNHTATYAKADGTTESFTTKYAVTSHRQVNGRSMALNENLALLLLADVNTEEPLYSEAKVTVELNGETKEFLLSDAEAHTDGRKMVSYRGVTPELAGDTITVKLYASNGTTVLDTKEYTISEYLTKLRDTETAATLGISETKKTALNQLVNDLLVYCGEAQIKFNHNTDALVSAGVTGTGAEPAGDVSVIWNKTAVTRDNYQDASAVPGYFKEATVIHENVNWIRVKYNDNAADDGTTFTVQKADGAETPVTLTGAYLVTEGLKPTEYGTRFIYRAYRGTEEISKVEYSMNSYCVRKHTYDGHAFSDALYNYGASAAAYASAS